jgi:hypothetical protein
MGLTFVVLLPAFLADSSNLQAVQKVLQSDTVSPEQVGLLTPLLTTDQMAQPCNQQQLTEVLHHEQKHVLKIIEKTFKVNSIEPQAQPLKVPCAKSPALFAINIVRWSTATDVNLGIDGTGEAQ